MSSLDQKLQAAETKYHIILYITSNEVLPSGAILIPLKIHNNTIGFIYLENASYLDEADKELIEIMINQCTFALDNLQSLKQIQSKW